MKESAPTYKGCGKAMSVLCILQLSSLFKLLPSSDGISMLGFVMTIMEECFVLCKSPVALYVTLQRLLKDSSGHVPGSTNCQVLTVAWAVRSFTIVANLSDCGAVVLCRFTDQHFQRKCWVAARPG